MCNHAENPCPGCKNHAATDAARIFFTKDERQAPEASRKIQVPARPSKHP